MKPERTATTGANQKRKKFVQLQLRRVGESPRPGQKEDASRPQKKTGELKRDPFRAL